MTRPTIEGSWKQHEEVFVSPEADALQRKAIKTAYYSGIATALFPLMDYIASLPEDEAMRELDRLHKEARDYANLAVAENLLLKGCP